MLLQTLLRDMNLQIGRKPSESEINRITKKFNKQYQKNIMKEFKNGKDNIINKGN